MQKVSFNKAVSSSLDKKGYGVVKDLLVPEDPTLPCSHIECSLEAAGTPGKGSWGSIIIMIRYIKNSVLFSKAVSDRL